MKPFHLGFRGGQGGEGGGGAIRNSYRWLAGNERMEKKMEAIIPTKGT